MEYTLCKILGVEVGERFEIEGTKRTPSGKPYKYYIDEYGRAVQEDEAEDEFGYMAIHIMDGVILSRIINNPDLVIRRPSLTKQEVAICKLVGGATYVSMDHGNPSDIMYVDLWTGNPLEGGNLVASVISKQFPSLRPGDCIKVEKE